MIYLTRNSFKIITLSSFGSALELYDFVIFAVFAKSIGETFFPHKNHSVELISAFALFAVGYLIRPIGGIVFSHFGDRIGRKKNFTTSIFLMAISTLLMSFVPSYQSIGMLAPLAFIFLRITQGFAIGGEIPGAITFVSEHIKQRAGLACGAIFLFNNVGIVFASVAHSIVKIGLTPTETANYGWRIAFVIGGLLAIISYLLRSRLEETPDFSHAKESIHKVPIYQLLRNHFPSVIAGILITSLGATIVSVLYLYMVSYLDTINNYSVQHSETLTFIGLISFSLSVFIIGAISDYTGRKKLIFTGALIFILFSLSFFKTIVEHRDNLAAWFILWGIISGLITGCYPCLLIELFPTNVRYSGVSFCFNIGFAVFGGLSPLIASLLIHLSGRLSSPAWVLITTSVFSVFGLTIIRRYKGTVTLIS
ncbi:MFS transporter [Piscirickettsia litoralis]|uniref:Major facilitator superfamily (MFS) profile domain-containing protein n=1 Tax=Piscirickettsia litoralis TaxID=1891921 RepID=A0ABX2ZYQ1_9GAMM|nr:MFS transporter [Piscirickettsia litoralis]ODN41325.1 hypothetical protein BGC07_16985 [Piscirickettsia litoralis]